MKENFFAKKTRGLLSGRLDFSHYNISIQSSLIEESLLAHGIHNRPYNQAGDRRQDQRAAESHGEALFASVQEAKHATNEEDDPSGLPPTLPISHACGVIAHDLNLAIGG